MRSSRELRTTRNQNVDYVSTDSKSDIHNDRTGYDIGAAWTQRQLQSKQRYAALFAAPLADELREQRKLDEFQRRLNSFGVRVRRRSPWWMVALVLSATMVAACSAACSRGDFDTPDGSFNAQPVWASDGWIYFLGKGYLWKVRSGSESVRVELPADGCLSAWSVEGIFRLTGDQVAVGLTLVCDYDETTAEENVFVAFDPVNSSLRQLGAAKLSIESGFWMADGSSGFLVPDGFAENCSEGIVKLSAGKRDCIRELRTAVLAVDEQRDVLYFTGQPCVAEEQSIDGWSVCALDLKTMSTTTIRRGLVDSSKLSPSIALSADGVRLAISTFSGLTIVDLDGSSDDIRVPGSFWDASFSPDGQSLVVTRGEVGSDESVLEQVSLQG